jgi:small-conductance mechanosensitive channel
MERLAQWTDWLWSLDAVMGAAIVGLGLHSVALAILNYFSRRTTSSLDDSLVRNAKGPLRAILPVLAILLTLPFVPLPPIVLDPLHHAVSLGLIAAVAWLAIKMINVVEDLLTVHHAVDVADNLAARRIRTQVEVLRQIVVFLVILVTLAVMLMILPSIRHLGESLFASAGLAALVAGLAAGSTFSNLIAGVQIAFTQAMRLDDGVIVEGEWGWIEEIHTTYVVVRIWDLRRLIVPLSYFIEKPFQNWKRQTADLLGSFTPTMRFRWKKYGRNFTGCWNPQNGGTEMFGGCSEQCLRED